MGHRGRARRLHPPADVLRVDVAEMKQVAAVVDAIHRPSRFRRPIWPAVGRVFAVFLFCWLLALFVSTDRSG